MLKKLLESGANIEAKDDQGWTPLIYGIHLNCWLNWNYLFILSIALHWNRIEVVKILLKKGANIEAKHEDGWTPLLFGIF